MSRPASDATPRRTAAATGLLGSLALLVGLGSLGDTPDPHDPSATMAEYFANHRQEVLTSSALTFVAMTMLVVFVVALRTALSPDRGRLTADIAAAGGLGFLVLLAANQLAYTTLAWDSGYTDPGALRTIFVLTVMATVVQGPACALLIAGTAACRGIALPPWYRWVSAIGASTVAVAVLASGQDGWVYADVQQQVVLAVFPAWVLTTAGVLAHGTGRAGSSRAGRPATGVAARRTGGLTPHLHLVSATTDPAFLHHRQSIRSLT